MPRDLLSFDEPDDDRFANPNWDAVRKLPTMLARFDSKCPSCRDSVVEGERLWKVDGRWVDEPCVEV